MSCTNYLKSSYYNTIDLDCHPFYRFKHCCDKEYLELVVNKIKYYGTKHRCLIRIEVEDSNSKGYHIKLWCKRRCDLCRLVFDDFERYRRDINRKQFCRNVLFQSRTKLSSP